MPTAKQRNTTQRGLGWKHQKQRARLLGQHVDGTPCWWCGKPMHKTQALAADHTHARAHGGTTADRLLHDLCNKERGDGSRDHERPALLKLRGGHPANSLNWG
ncbi:HNH endonuclease [Gordonia phage Bjanes7]|uniref:HNH endonuclease n=4 Tax=Attisvirus TaxID=2169652 RepID=A0A7T3KBP0_9CAUD|nr:HNH endonuclease [Gordonia phage Lamberg]YP_010653861.1 HNH endonuclease [Gordonia phage Bjanes7]YP_010653939.1 HNH endonuclease [Gordonia phage Ebert]AZS12819.1 HNH endonuclease [Gordonia phage Sproutie]AZS12896.1 HNH endonuclease [Gordonia phage Savage]QCW22557.1 HNH endonuclease [Gordonia phage Haley23]QGJ96697.1 HNH endonuclease [Gordonia phage Cynthia]QOC59198.1 HNH endonuclease [Gordonia phage GemG]QPL13640.1 HNH endonuclease [Gordonia phage Mocha12]UUG69860.1 HNH endonuclease [Go